MCIRDSTLIVFTSDNGFFYGEHRIDGGKLRHYEEATRVPLMIRGPGFEPGSHVGAPVINADLAPTLLDAAGVEAPVEPDGISLLPFGPDPELDPGRDLLLESRHYAGIRTDRHIYVEHGSSGGSRELYDLESDPYELDNLAGERGRRRLQADLARRLGELRDCAGAACR